MTIVAVPAGDRRVLEEHVRAVASGVSARDVFGSFGTGALSPVSAASCVSSVADLRRRPSAGTMSPASTGQYRPARARSAGTSAACRRARPACGICSFARASTLALAFNSWRVPRKTLQDQERDDDAGRDLADHEADRGYRDSMMFIGSRSCASETSQTEVASPPQSGSAQGWDSRLAASWTAQSALGIAFREPRRRRPSSLRTNGHLERRAGEAPPASFRT